MYTGGVFSCTMYVNGSAKVIGIFILYFEVVVCGYSAQFSS